MPSRRNSSLCTTPAYGARFPDMPREYIDRMLGAIVSFTIEVTRLDARFKLSQEKLPVERERIIASSRSRDSWAAETAELMRKHPVSADLVAPYAIVDAANPPRLDDVRRLFRDYAEWIGVDLGFQDFEQELATLPGKYAAPGRAAAAPRARRGGGGLHRAAAFDKSSGEVKRLYVRPAERGRGLGKALAAAVVDAARTIGYRRLMLDTLEPMMEARELYRSFGFAEIPAYYSNPLPGAIYMELKL